MNKTVVKVTLPDEQVSKVLLVIHRLGGIMNNEETHIAGGMMTIVCKMDPSKVSEYVDFLQQSAFEYELVGSMSA